MLRNERQEWIKKMIQQKKNLKISEISAQLHVSEMTIHRDIKPLIEDGLIHKTFGGITLAVKSKPPVNSNACTFCHRTIDDRLSYRIILKNGQVESTCCAHCGLLRQDQIGDQVLQAICYDFLSHTTISAVSAWFVMDSKADIRCCQPQLIPFQQRDSAERFVRGFEGKVLTMEEAMDQIRKRMDCGSGTCHEK